MRSAYLASNPAGRPVRPMSAKTSARASSRPTSKSASASPRASIARGSARRLRTLTAPGFDRMTIASPSQTNQVGTRCGAPSARVDDSQITGSVSRNRRTRAAARSVVSMAAASGAGPRRAADDRRGPAWTSVDAGLRPYTRPRSAARRREPPETVPSMSSLVAMVQVSLRRSRAAWPIVASAGLICLLAASLLAAGPDVRGCRVDRRPAARHGRCAGVRGEHRGLDAPRPGRRRGRRPRRHARAGACARRSGWDRPAGWALGLVRASRAGDGSSGRI